MLTLVGAVVAERCLVADYGMQDTDMTAVVDNLLLSYRAVVFRSMMPRLVAVLTSMKTECCLESDVCMSEGRLPVMHRAC